MAENKNKFNEVDKTERMETACKLNLFSSVIDEKNILDSTLNLSDFKGDFKEIINSIAMSFNKAVIDASEKDKFKSNIDRLQEEGFHQLTKSLALALECRDPYTGGHSDRVYQISKDIGKRFNLSPKDQLNLEGGALLHDLGKLSVRDSVLLKPGPLTDIEYKEMQLHPIFGAQLIKKFPLLEGCLDPVLYHHERIDGYGYPYGLKGEEIPLIAKITAVTDAYDAMTTNRVYRRALSHEQAIQEVLRNSGTQFDKEVVEVFISWWEETFQSYPEKGKELYKDILYPAND